MFRLKQNPKRNVKLRILSILKIKISVAIINF